MQSHMAAKHACSESEDLTMESVRIDDDWCEV